MLHLNYFCAGKLVLQLNPPPLDRNESHFPGAPSEGSTLSRTGIHLPLIRLYDMINSHT